MCLFILTHTLFSMAARAYCRKHEALIPEAQGAYLGSTRRLFRKHGALIPEALGAYSGSAGRVGDNGVALRPPFCRI